MLASHIHQAYPVSQKKSSLAYQRKQSCDLLLSVLITPGITCEITQKEVKRSVISLSEVVNLSDTKFHVSRTSVHSLQNTSMARSEKRNHQYLFS